MRAVDILRKKRDGLPLDRAEVEAFVAGVTSGAWPDYQAAALLMAVVLRGMTAEETAWLTAAMARSGERLDLSGLPGPTVDKHSTGGVGDKTSLVVAPVVAACGGVVPMMSGRGLGHTGGTLDKLEAIPGYRTALSPDEFRAALRRVGCAIAGQTAALAPADRTLYALRDVTATVESVPLITASIMSKKIAEGTVALVLDVKCGRGAFMKTPGDARRLAEALVATGNANGVRTEALVTAMDFPLGRAVGNALEVEEAVRALKGEGPADLDELSRRLAERMLLLAGLADDGATAAGLVGDALASGRALEKFRAMVEQQGGDPRVVDDPARLPRAPHRYAVTADRGGYLNVLDAELVGRATSVLGAGRSRAGEAVDPGVGAVIRAGPGERVAAGEPVLELIYRDGTKLGEALGILRGAVALSDEPAATPLVLETVIKS